MEQRARFPYKKGMRLAYIWLDKSYTTGTIRQIKKGMVLISWDDKTTTNTPLEWVSSYTRPLDRDGIPVLDQLWVPVNTLMM